MPLNYTLMVLSECDIISQNILFNGIISITCKIPKNSIKLIKELIFNNQIKLINYKDREKDVTNTYKFKGLVKHISSLY